MIPQSRFLVRYLCQITRRTQCPSSSLSSHSTSSSGSVSHLSRTSSISHSGTYAEHAPQMSSNGLITSELKAEPLVERHEFPSLLRERKMPGVSTSACHYNSSPASSEKSARDMSELRKFLRNLQVDQRSNGENLLSGSVAAISFRHSFSTSSVGGQAWAGRALEHLTQRNCRFSPTSAAIGMRYRVRGDPGMVSFQRRRYGSGTEVLWTLIGANLVVYGMWQTLDHRFMLQNFTVSLEKVRQGRWHTILTSAFSQREPYHLLANMVTFYFFGSQIAYRFGGPYLLGLYLSGGAVSSLCHMGYFKYIYPEMERRRGNYYVFDTPALGASGSVNSIVMLSCLLNPGQIIYLNMFIPVPAIVLGLGYIAMDLYGATRTAGGTGNAGHLGGAFVGVLAWALFRSRGF
eukprot:TRINITY_DN22127_c0_g2_i1.p1 TRINITY_DN22127_c0_g2~~TRINITY_DN22127_c0_g2_i1.p1  ORF type:complete len:404 (-),score=24.40 TRINITY_DN22127_c0_g2_i1:370-1581(-)